MAGHHLVDKTPSIPVLKLCVHLAPESESEGFSIEVKKKKKELENGYYEDGP